jgi:hypothetical protein
MAGGSCTVTWRKRDGRWLADRKAFLRYQHIYATEGTQLIARTLKRVFVAPLFRSFTQTSASMRLFRYPATVLLEKPASQDGRYIELRVAK